MLQEQIESIEIRPDLAKSLSTNIAAYGGMGSYPHDPSSQSHEHRECTDTPFLWKEAVESTRDRRLHEELC